MSAAELVKALGGSNGMARCPAHDDCNPSLAVSEGRNGQVLIHCHAGCEQAVVIKVLKSRGLWPDYGECRPRGKTVKLLSKESEQDRVRAAMQIWEDSRPAAHGPVREYLNCRGIVIEVPPVLRFHEAMNAMIALVQHVDGSFGGIQRVFLERDDYGTWKRQGGQATKSLGAIKGGAIRLTPNGQVLRLAESIEDAMALNQMAPAPTWAVPGAGFMRHFVPRRETRQLVLAPDNDAAGNAAILAATPVLRPMLHKLLQLLPPPGCDWCDVLGPHQERLALQNELPITRPKSESRDDG